MLYRLFVYKYFLFFPIHKTLAQKKIIKNVIHNCFRSEKLNIFYFFTLMYSCNS